MAQVAEGAESGVVRADGRRAGRGWRQTDGPPGGPGAAGVAILSKEMTEAARAGPRSDGTNGDRGSGGQRLRLRLAM